MLKRLATVAACLSVLVLSACGNEADGSETASDSSETSGETSEETSEEPAASGETTTCEYPSDGQEPARDVEAPETEATAEGTVPATITTNFGDIGLTLDAASAPCTVNSFVSLAEQGFYDDTPCPRIGDMDGFGILQCGDPSGTGAGGAGYSFADELSGDETYPAGTLAMANAGPDTNGSQFFLVFRDSQFPPSYNVFGTIDEAGLEVLTEIAAVGNDNSNPAGGGAPNEDVTIEEVTIG
ncbi:peptidyl-prolyl cis-trans isomerase [Nocardioides flavus (ex Wang et al. 2016)]|uniref:Peptidyl-prolyl cis-trans isomerase n=1 Tax=Nocardioides flavus (ex Wang et al. 2016) TaxID=2058780 RepID=A0ABQ3HPM9_9ACTN|nr:peptidylprolyl isomerase [Nocardioides flavus (ex Wang et al. 2016)]GHE18074.1 peptidyl-prolyl cis-trans isomerase [Nocardioides flavus (ex Wang et al. 2016)]